MDISNAVEFKLLVAIATFRNKKAAGFQSVMRERTTDSKFRVPPLSSYIRYRDLPMVPDLVLFDYLKEDLTYSENKELAKQWQQYSSRKRPTSRPLEHIQSGENSATESTKFRI